MTVPDDEPVEPGRLWACVRCGGECDPLAPRLCGTCAEPLCGDACEAAHVCDGRAPLA